MIDTISIKRLIPVHPDLNILIAKALQLAANAGVTIRVTSGVRTAEEQLSAFKSGASKLSGTPKSKGGTGVSEHQYGMAVDLVELVGGKAVWSGASMARIHQFVKEASKLVKIPYEWGGNWKGFVDPPHYQLPRSVYKTPHIKV